VLAGEGAYWVEARVYRDKEDGYAVAGNDLCGREHISLDVALRGLSLAEG
jgi:hypothetical protein